MAIGGGPLALLAIFGIIAGIVLTVMVFMYVLVPVLKGIGWVIGRFFWLIGATIAHIFRFVAGVFRDTFRAIGAVPAALVFALLCVGSVVVGRWSGAAHFASNMQREFATLGGCLYRLCLGHPLRLLGLHPVLEGIEERVPAAMAEAPGADKPSRRTGIFEGYEIVGSLPGGGSGGRLYVAVPNLEKRGQISKANNTCPERVVIKAFAVADGSSVPQIVRESRALECAKQLGLILDHELTDERFFYVMPYVPGESLASLARVMHARNGNEGLGENDIRRILGYLGDVLNTLDTYHRGGLWHKDIKPENIIVSDDGKAHVVDLGLITPLRSAMTLTTHGTEYFRDPEMVRMALRGAKVHEVDGAKFDIYAAGAVLFFMLENTFPSHGGLSTISKRSPEAVKWIVRRAMTEYSKRYQTAAEMFEDIRAVATHPRMEEMKPAELPSLRKGATAATADDLHAVAGPGHASFGDAPEDRAAEVRPGARPGGHDWEHAHPGPGFGDDLGAAAASPEHAAASDRSAPWRRPRTNRKKYRFKVTNWWTGAFVPAEGAIGAGIEQGSVTDEIRQAGYEIRDAVHEATREARRAARRVRSDVRGRYGLDDDEEGVVAAAAGSPRPRPHDPARPSAHEQVARARGRATDLRRRARQRGGRHHRVRAPGERVGAGMIVAAMVVLGTLGLAAIAAYSFLADRAGGPDMLFGRESASSQVRVHGPSERSVTAETWSRRWGHAPGESSGEAAAVAPSAEPARSAIGMSLPADFPMGFMIINDHPQPTREAIASTESGIAERIESLGFNARSSDEDEALIRARVAQWITGPYAVGPGEHLERAEQAVGDLLRREIEDVGCVVWLYPIADQPDRVRYWVITPDAPRSEIDDRILDYLLSRS